MKITARIPSIKEITVDVPSNITVAELKRILCERLKIEQDLTKLLANGIPLQENQKVSKIKLKSKKLEIDYLWSRQLILWGEDGQAKLGKSNVLIAGAGAIANEAAKNLAMLGIRNFTIIDYDKVEVSNLSRMVFFDKSDAGKPKSKVEPKNVREKLLEEVIKEHYGRPLGVLELARELPAIHSLVQFSPWLGFQEKVDKEWRLIAEAGAELINVARLTLDTFPQLEQKYQTADSSLTREDIVARIIQNELDLLWNDWKSLLIAQLPKVKVWKEREAETHYERELVRPVLTDGKGGRTSTKMRRALEAMQSEGDEE